MDIDTLYPLVTEAIREAEALEARNDPSARQAFSEVSRLEEHISRVLPLSDYEGIIARRGAVRAAIKAHHCARALQLIARFESEAGIDDELAADLTALKTQAIALATQDQERFVHLVGPRTLSENDIGPANADASAIDSSSVQTAEIELASAVTAIEVSRDQLRHKLAVWLTGVVVVSIALLLLAALVLPPERKALASEIALSLVPALIAVYGTVMGFYFGERRAFGRAGMSAGLPVVLASGRMHGTGHATAGEAQRGKNDPPNRETM